MHDPTRLHVLVLNRHWLAVHICSARRAISLLYQGSAHAVSEDYQTYDFDSWMEFSQNGGFRAGKMLRTPSFQLRLPQVIVLRRYHKAPPRTVRFNRRNVYIRDRGQCQYCGHSPGREHLTIDHVVPKSRGGQSSWHNVVVACTSCNTKKGSRLPGECNMHPRIKPKRPSWMTALHIMPHSDERAVWAKFVNAAS